MLNVIIENVVQIVAALLLMLIGVLGTWLTAKIGKKAELTNISIATNELFAAFAETIMPAGGIGRYDGFTHIDSRADKARWNG